MITLLGASELRRAVLAALEAVRARQDEIDAANVYPVPDGDTGTNLSLTLTAVAEALPGAPDQPRALADAIARGSLLGARGNSGVILAQVLRGLCEAVDASGLDARGLTKGLARGAELAYEAVLTPVEGTMLTVARAAADAAGGFRGDDCSELLDVAARAAHEALERTPELLPLLKQSGVVDAGGMGLCVLLDAFAASVAGRALPVAPRMLRPIVRQREAGSSTFAYEVQYLLEGSDDEQAVALRQRLGSIGDSVAVIGGAGLWNVHVHTNEVGRSIEMGMAAGRPHDISVVAFADQIAGVAGARSISLAMPDAAVTLVAVASGDGIRELFAELGAGVLLEGGRTMNPSVGDLRAALERAPADDVILVVGNEDAFPAARAAMDAVEGKRVALAPAKDLAQAFVAAVAFSDGRTFEDNVTDIEAALQRTATGSVTLAMRDGMTPTGTVRAGHALGFARGEVVASGPDPVAVALDVLDHLGHGEVLTVLGGMDASPGELEVFVEQAAERRPGIEIEVRDGGQPVHRYLIALE